MSDLEDLEEIAEQAEKRVNYKTDCRGSKLGVWRTSPKRTNVFASLKYAKPKPVTLLKIDK